MRQSLHIFRKDIRHLWPECAVYASILFIFALAAPLARPGHNPPVPLVQTAVRLLTFLMPIMFFVLIVRTVHEERLVGGEPFWITRPYRWTSLLAAKCIFIVICVILPFALMQAWLVFHAGLSLIDSSSGMTHSMVGLCVNLLIPSLLIAAITSTLAEAFMMLAGVVVTWICILLTFFGDSINMSPPHSWEILAVIFAVLLTSILIYQYATRRTAWSRIAFILTAILFIVLIYGFSCANFGGPVRAMIRSQYPLSAQSSLRLVALPGTVSYTERDKDMYVPKGFLEVKLPVRLEGFPPDYKVHNVNISFTANVHGFHYISPWQSAGITDDVLSFAIPRSVLDRAGTDAMHLHIEFLAEALRPDASQVISVGDSFKVPDNGRCFLNYGIPTCQYAFGMLVPTQIVSSNEHTPCASTSNKSNYGALHVIPNGGRVDPIIQQEIRLKNKVCFGSMLTFSEYRSAGNFRLELDLPSVNIAQYLAL